MSIAFSFLVQTAAAPPNEFEKWLMANPWLFITIVGLSVAVAVLGVILFRIKVNYKPAKMNEDDLRHLVAKSVLFSAIWGLIIVAALAILTPSGVGNKAEKILTMLLPVFGTWVGTLLAYYFGKDNYESGARNSENMARAVGGLEKLRSIAAKTKMIGAGAIERPPSWQNQWPTDYGAVLLKGLVDEMPKQRLPLLDAQTGGVVAVVHKSLITEFLLKQVADAEVEAKKANAAAPAADIAMAGANAMAKATLKGLLDDSGIYGKTAKKSFATVPSTATLAEVKEQMDQQGKAAEIACEDAFLVSPGTIRVEGWITNDIINENSQA